MSTVSLPYGKSLLNLDIPEDHLAGILIPKLHKYIPETSGAELVHHALTHPIGTDRLCDLVVGKKRIVVISSDHTRPVPSRIIMPQILAEIRAGNPDADITILIATGLHRASTAAELEEKFGPDIVRNEKIVVHDCDDSGNLVYLGTLPSGGRLVLNRLAVEADLLVAEGFIEPHFFAGFSGGRKSVLPGIAGRTTVLANHCSEFIDNPNSRTGILEGNPIHKDMLWAAKTAKLKYIVNVVLNAEKEVIYAVAGDPEKAHEKGTDFLSSLCRAQAVEADVAISTNGGYPLDQNVYQAVKGMTAAEATVKKDGVIIMLAASDDGIGGDHFYHQLADEEDIYKTIDIFLKRGRKETVPDQWQTQILLRIFMHARVIYISEIPDDLVEQMHMIPAHSIAEAIEKAKQILEKEDIKITAIPDGVSVMVTK